MGIVFTHSKRLIAARGKYDIMDHVDHMKHRPLLPMRVAGRALLPGHRLGDALLSRERKQREKEPEEPKVMQ